MKKATLIILSIFLFLSCSTNDVKLTRTESYKEKSVMKIDEINQISLSDSLQPIVDSLAECNMIIDKYIGYGGIKSKTYEYFEKLVATSTESELIALTNHVAPNIRAYSFWALAKNRNKAVKQILLNNINDTTSIDFFSGCVIETVRLNDFYLSVVDPQCLDINSPKLTEKDIKEIKLMMK